MKRFDVCTNVTIQMVHIVEADSAEEAEKKAKEMYKSGELEGYAWANADFKDSDVYEIIEITELDDDE